MGTQVDRVWYVSYGSNMSYRRLSHYLQGGRPPGAKVSYRGARDSRLPTRHMPVILPGSLYFAGESPTWGGGVAFYDHDTPGQTAARAYVLSISQFADVAAQEMHRLPSVDSPLEDAIRSGFSGQRLQVGPGRYETIVKVGEADDIPMFTFTAPEGINGVPHTRPVQNYLNMLSEGLQDAHEWDETQVNNYFAERIQANQ